MGARAGQSEVELADAELVHVMQQAHLVVEVRVGRARRLDAVAQRLIEHARQAQRAGWALDGARFGSAQVPVVEQARRAHLVVARNAARGVEP